MASVAETLKQWKAVLQKKICKGKIFFIAKDKIVFYYQK